MGLALPGAFLRKGTKAKRAEPPLVCEVFLCFQRQCWWQVEEIHRFSEFATILLPDLSPGAY